MSRSRYIPPIVAGAANKLVAVPLHVSMSFQVGDMVAAYPTLHSLAFGLDNAGWQVLLVEPREEAAAKLRRRRISLVEVPRRI